MEGGSQGPQLQLWRGCAGDSRLGTRGFPKVNFQCPVTNMSWLLGPWMALGQCVLPHNTQGAASKAAAPWGQFCGVLPSGRAKSQFIEPFQ